MMIKYLALYLACIQMFSSFSCWKIHERPLCGLILILMDVCLGGMAWHGGAWKSQQPSFQGSVEGCHMVATQTTLYLNNWNETYEELGPIVVPKMLGRGIRRSVVESYSDMACVQELGWTCPRSKIRRDAGQQSLIDPPYMCKGVSCPVSKRNIEVGIVRIVICNRVCVQCFHFLIQIFHKYQMWYLMVLDTHM